MTIHPRLRGVAAGLAGLLLAAPVAAACASGLPVGRIERVEASTGAAAAMRLATNGKRGQVQAYEWLCAGDLFELADGVRVVAVLANGAERVFTTSSPGPVPAANAVAAGGPPGMLAFLGDVMDRLGAVRKPAALFNQARDPGQAQPPLLPDALLPPGEQVLPAGVARMALLWRGGPGIVAVQAEGGDIATVSSGRRAYAVVAVPPQARRLTLQLADQALAWQVRVAAEPAPALPAAQRLARAMQVLREGPAQERLFALSELAQLSAEGDYAAEQLWAAARSGELAAALAWR